jgi:glycerophosphoryl diester phosphodiesterase
MIQKPLFLKVLILLLLAGNSLAAALVIGHRGTGPTEAGNDYPENSIPAILRGFEEGADLVEIDVQLTREGEVILWHNEYVEVDGDKFRPGELSLDQFPLLVGDHGMTASVPTFREALQAALNADPTGKVMDVEIKVYRSQDRDALTQALAQVIREERAARRIMVCSFDHDALKNMEAELPGVESGLLGIFRFTTLRAAKRLAREGIPIKWVLPSKWAPFNLPLAAQEELQLSRKELDRLQAKELQSQEESGVEPTTSSFIRGAHEAGFRVGVWTVNKRSKMEDLAIDGFDAFITNRPDLGRQVADQ